MANTNNKIRRKIRFSQRLFWSIFTMFLGFIVCFLLFHYQREYELSQDKLGGILSNYNYQLHEQIIRTGNIERTVSLFLEEIPQKDLRVTIIDSEGNVVYDNISDKEDFENHYSRSEVRKARQEGEGSAVRTSTSNGIKYFYSADRFDDFVYRTALPYDRYISNIWTVRKEYLYFLILMTTLFFFVLLHFSANIGRTLSKLSSFALDVENNVENNDVVESANYSFPNDELGDIAQNIIKIYHRELETKRELSMEREKFNKHFQYSQDGFAMFTADGKELYSNILFLQLINIISDAQIRQIEDTLQTPELEPIRTFLRTHIAQLSRREKVLRESVTVEKSGKIFQVECILFLDNSYELSINDISRQEEETRMKRELTQNVSHELKTPVSSILGYLETILSTPDLSPEKMHFFLERCYSQSTRLAGLLRDISVLNRLDEAKDMFDLAEVSITKLIHEIINECSIQIKNKNIVVDYSLPGDPKVYGNYSLLYSIFRNLFDNSIAYAGEGIKITINCYREADQYYYFRFADNGVGFAEEHLNRIFERFYRVDKGRSRKEGGTGLGLSIVKNAVTFHKGHISAKSKPGEGTEFFFTLKKNV